MIVEAGISQVHRDAGRVAARAEIRDVRLLSTSASIIRFPAPNPQLSYTLDQRPSVEYSDGGDSFVVRASYSLKISELNDEGNSDDESAVVATVQFEQAALFLLAMLENDETPEAEELEAFAGTTGQFALHPFAREYIYDITGRLALPPLTIGVLRLSMPSDD